MCFEMVLSVNCSCYPKNYFLGFYLNFAVFIVQFSMCKFRFSVPGPGTRVTLRFYRLYLRLNRVVTASLSLCRKSYGGLKWTRTTDLTIISRVL